MKKLILLVYIIYAALPASDAQAESYLNGTGDPNDPYLIEDLADFDAFASDPNYWAAGVHTKLMCDPNLSGRTYTTAVIAPDTDNQDDVFDGISFAGIFDGNVHNICNVTIDPNGVGNDFLGLFGYIDSGAEVKNINIEDVIVIGGNNSEHIGGLCGHNDGSISNCYSNSSVIGIYSPSSLGGLCGGNNGNIVNCNSTGSVTGGGYYVGGLCGSNGGNIINCYANNLVSSAGPGSGVGGLCGSSCGYISNCYSTGPVTGSVFSSYVGGLCGLNNCNWRLFGTISNCYSTSPVSGGLERIGGLLGDVSGSINNSFWDIEIGGPDNGVGIPKTTLEMQDPNTFISAIWDFVGETINGTDNYWRLCKDGIEYPKLAWQSMMGDIACPDGVNLFDYAYFAERWLEDDCDTSNNCGGADIDTSGIVGIADAVILAENWLEGTE